ncbi:hypothetical protein ACEZCY_24945 [Streptacidiphilus sp. N1-12]|uniref:Uncharacterized protein n=2 Tax=Streptacidiphilus alkalitolerans TaxID=3342712 RepID=A0ABV6V8D3_9ACTN
MSLSPEPRPDLQRAVDRANAAIRQFWLGLAGGHPLTRGEWEYHDALVAEWNAAMVAREDAGHEGEDGSATRVA